MSPFLFVFVSKVFNKLVSWAVELGLICSVQIGRAKVDLSHIQFAYDTLLFCPSDVECIKNYKWLLQCFEVMFGLYINFDKLALIPLNHEEELISKMQNVLRCCVTKLPITYLGIPLGENPRRISTWQPIRNKVEKRLSS